jgi:hypothetical protein
MSALSYDGVPSSVKADITLELRAIAHLARGTGFI